MKITIYEQQRITLTRTTTYTMEIPTFKLAEAIVEEDPSEQIRRWIDYGDPEEVNIDEDDEDVHDERIWVEVSEGNEDDMLARAAKKELGVHSYDYDEEEEDERLEAALDQVTRWWEQFTDPDTRY